MVIVISILFYIDIFKKLESKRKVLFMLYPMSVLVSILLGLSYGKYNYENIADVSQKTLKIVQMNQFGQIIYEDQGTFTIIEDKALVFECLYKDCQEIIREETVFRCDVSKTYCRDNRITYYLD